MNLEQLERCLGEGGSLGVSARLISPTGKTTAELDYRGEQRFPMASVVKVPIGLALEMIVQRGEVSWDDRVTITSGSVCPGPLGNSLDRMFFCPWKWKRSKTTLELLRLMLTRSDNTAADMLLERIDGPAGVRKFLSEIGIGGIEVRRSIHDLLTCYFDLPPRPRRQSALAWAKTSRQTIRRLHAPFVCRPAKEDELVRTGEDTSTPAAMTDLLTVAFAESRFVQVGKAMRACQTGATRIRKGLMASKMQFRWLAHKTGTLGGILNDVGVVERDDGTQVAISIFICGASVPLAARDQVIADAVKSIMEGFN